MAGHGYGRRWRKRLGLLLVCLLRRPVDDDFVLQQQRFTTRPVARGLAPRQALSNQVGATLRRRVAGRTDCADAAGGPRSGLFGGAAIRAEKPQQEPTTRVVLLTKAASTMRVVSFPLGE